MNQIMDEGDILLRDDAVGEKFDVPGNGHIVSTISPSTAKRRTMSMISRSVRNSLRRGLEVICVLSEVWMMRQKMEQPDNEEVEIMQPLLCEES